VTYFHFVSEQEKLKEGENKFKFEGEECYIYVLNVTSAK